MGFNLELPNDIIKDIEKVSGNSEKFFGAMTQAGAEVVEHNMINNAPNSLKKYVNRSKTYKTPSDDGINTKVQVVGYMPFSGNRTTFTRNGYSTSEGVPADFVAKVYEYGRSGLPFPKKPFVRKSFKKSQIEQAMLKAQKEASGGLLDE